jgi:N6-L-threonylcarbamoyladenine synthase
MRILAIETSCDDTGIAILEVSKTGNFSVLSNIVASQIEVHKKYGGVYPMMAKREHQKNLVPVLIKSLKESCLLKTNLSENFTSVKKSDISKILEREPELLKKLIPFLKKYERPNIDLIAVTNGPGLEPCLWVGVNFAKALSYFWNIPIVPVNHIESHILVNFLASPKLLAKAGPATALVVSGGHTQLILMKKIGDYKILGETRDDAAGECFDKCAKILGLGYPGGPVISKLAETSLPGKITLPRPMINTKDYDFSFSGLKTAVLYADRKVKNNPATSLRARSKEYKKQMSAEIQQAIIDVLLKKTIKAAKDFKAKTIILGGGVSANTELRKQFKKKLEENKYGFFAAAKKPYQINLLVPKPNLSTDNALMTAITGYFHKNKKASLKTLKADANLRISK